MLLQFKLFWKKNEVGGRIVTDMTINTVLRVEDDMVQEERQTSKSIE